MFHFSQSSTWATTPYVYPMSYMMYIPEFAIVYFLWNITYEAFISEQNYEFRSLVLAGFKIRVIDLNKTNFVFTRISAAALI